MIMIYEVQVGDCTTRSFHATLYGPHGAIYVTAKSYRKLMEKVRKELRAAIGRASYWYKGEFCAPSGPWRVEVKEYFAPRRLYQRARWQGRDPMEGWGNYMKVRLTERTI